MGIQAPNVWVCRLTFDDQWYITYATVYAEPTPLHEVAYAGYGFYVVPMWAYAV